MLAPRLLPRVAAPKLSEFLARQHAANKVRIICGVNDVAIDDSCVVRETQLARGALIECQDRIVVDRSARTSDARIGAVGDCARHANDLLGRPLRLETVHNALEQAKVAARAVCGESTTYRQTPWVWSDQYAFRLQIVGLIDGYDRHVVRGDPASGRFSVAYFQGDRFLALQAVNRPAEFAAARRILNGGVALSVNQAADPAFDLAGMARPQRRLQFSQPWTKRVRAAS